MQCDGCAERLEALLRRTTGVRDAEVDFSGKTAALRYNPHVVDLKGLTAVIEKAGFSVARSE